MSKTQDCYIVGGGPSLINFDWSQLEDKFVIAINRAYEVLPNADIVYFTDQVWYEQHGPALLKHKGKLIKGSTHPGLRKIDSCVQEYKLVRERGLETGHHELSHGRNSAYAAINLAGVHLEFKRIYLLGIDMQYNNAQSHWHDGHKRVDPESVYKNMLKNFNHLAEILPDFDFEVFNINTPEFSKLEGFPFSDKLTLSYDPTQPGAIHKSAETEKPTYNGHERSPIRINPQQARIDARKNQLEKVRRFNKRHKN